MWGKNRSMGTDVKIWVPLGVEGVGREACRRWCFVLWLQDLCTTLCVCFTLIINSRKKVHFITISYFGLLISCVPKINFTSEFLWHTLCLAWVFRLSEDQTLHLINIFKILKWKTVSFSYIQVFKFLWPSLKCKLIHYHYCRIYIHCGTFYQYWNQMYCCLKYLNDHQKMVVNGRLWKVMFCPLFCTFFLI